MRTLSAFATLTVGVARRALSAFVTLLVAVAIVPVRVAAVESQWLTGQPPEPGDRTEARLVSSWHVMAPDPAPDTADPPIRPD